MGLMRIPYTAPLPAPRIIPSAATTLPLAIEALVSFLKPSNASPPKTLLLTGAGISVASGLADYRGPNGTYTLNKTYRPIYYHEFCASHAARRRYWARSFLGWTNLSRSGPNIAHHAVSRLGTSRIISSVITQNVDSFHPVAHPGLSTLELHGYLRNVVCISCRRESPRTEFQTKLRQLNPSWAGFLDEMIASGALSTEDPDERRRLGFKTNPDGDVDVAHGISYETFDYPACSHCQQGVLKPAVIMFGESIPSATKVAAEQAVDGAERMLIAGSSLATYSAWRLVKRARDRGIPVAIANLGGARGEEGFFGRDNPDGVRIAQSLEQLLPAIADRLD